ncbi:HmuY family protein [Maribacter sp. SA7]|uniref:HmuY family protein n=1 Tax=Maribacter zhoushanensis TaxID=3030012 RepID=UPI0023EBC7BA|nr:HmuY family protein [Maribacter zhoushanensis]MDF4203369.1 HmuY family protein [Maribacter zhoushanensis]
MTKNILAVAFLTLTFASCSNDDDSTPTDPVQTETVSNLYAPQTGGQGQPVGGEFTKFDFETGAVTTSDTDWDVAFRGTTIAVNGGAVTGTEDEPERNGNAAVAEVTGTLASVTTAEDLTFNQDADATFAIATGSDNGWYNYAGDPTHLITPIPGKVFVFRTTAGNYAKVEFISYYEDAPAEPDAFADGTPYYTFNYVYNPNEGDTSLD